MASKKSKEIKPLEIGRSTAMSAGDKDVVSDVRLGSVRATINLTVNDALKWEFKEWCTRHRMTQVDAFREGFKLLKRQYGR